ncbi:hypothetical protein ON010_g4833 [Phytophthora cinnamomi]|nr:hypothetical protein ON010_g4833 [Phytophthora cinnamomi]
MARSSISGGSAKSSQWVTTNFPVLAEFLSAESNSPNAFVDALAPILLSTWNALVSLTTSYSILQRLDQSDHCQFPRPRFIGGNKSSVYALPINRSQNAAAGIVGAESPAASAAAVDPAASHLAAGSAPFQRCYQAPRFFSSSTTPWKANAVSNPVAWQEAVKPALVAPDGSSQVRRPPRRWRVPRGSWREGGRKIDQKQREELDDIGTSEVLRVERPHRCTVGLSHSEREPEHLWGRLLGNQVINIRRQSDFAEQVQADKDELKRLNFWHESTLYWRNWREKVMPALRTFHREFGRCNVGNALTVPLHLPWPKAAWGMRLGSTVKWIRYRDTAATKTSPSWKRWVSCGIIMIGGDRIRLEDRSFQVERACRANIGYVRAATRPPQRATRLRGSVDLSLGREGLGRPVGKARAERIAPGDVATTAPNNLASEASTLKY